MALLFFAFGLTALMLALLSPFLSLLARFLSFLSLSLSFSLSLGSALFGEMVCSSTTRLYGKRKKKKKNNRMLASGEFDRPFG